MKCKEVAISLEDYIDNKLDINLSKEIENHIKKCKRCRKEYDALYSLHKIQNDIHTLKAPDSLLQRINESIDSQENIFAKIKELFLTQTKLKLTFTIAGVAIIVVSLVLFFIINSMIGNKTKITKEDEKKIEKNIEENKQEDQKKEIPKKFKEKFQVALLYNADAILQSEGILRSADQNEKVDPLQKRINDKILNDYIEKRLKDILAKHSATELIINYNQDKIIDKIIFKVLPKNYLNILNELKKEINISGEKEQIDTKSKKFITVEFNIDIK